jgi:hypothetical protein
MPLYINDGKSPLEAGGITSGQHAVIDHTGVSGVGDLTTVAHGTTDHTGILGVGKVLQRLFVERDGGDPAAHSIGIPVDGTIPQGNEGYLTLSLSITPLSTTSKIVAKSGIWGGTASSFSNHIQAAMGRGTGNMDVATETRTSVSSPEGLMTLCSEYASGSTSTQNWRVITGFRGDSTASFPPTVFGAAGRCWMELIERES